MATHGSHYGPTFVPALDASRLSAQRDRIRNVMLAASITNRWLTLGEMSETLESVYDCRFPEASISAQLRHLKRPENGGYCLEKRRRGAGTVGLWEYRLLAPVQLVPEQLDFTKFVAAVR